VQLTFRVTRTRLVLVVAAAALSVGGVAWATIPGVDNTIHGCYRTAGGDNQGQLRVVETSARCRGNETAIEWNQQGVPGATGATGPAGPTGPQGPKGEKGEKGATGATGAAGTQGPKGDPGNDGAPGTNGTNGAQGLQGLQGLQGPQGPQGPQGTSGSTTVFSVGPTSRSGVDVQPNNAQSPSSIGTLTLPVGTYLVLANVTFVNSASFFAQDNSRQIRCGFGWLGGLGNPTTDMDVPGAASSAMAVQTIVTQNAAGAISLNCRSETGDNVDSHVNATNFIITAVKLDSVN
jgi:hypothetical protein